MSFTDNTKQILADTQNKINKALETCGLTAEGYAKLKCPVDTGALRNSITHTVADNSMIIGTNMEYATYVEFGTGEYASKGGRQTPWVYKDSKGNWHRTNGSKAQPFIKPSLADYRDKYLKIIQSTLRG